MKLTSLFMLLILGACGSSSNGFKTPYFKLVKATSQDWIAGAKGSGMGTTYQFEIIAKTSDEVKYTTAWIGEVSYPISAKVPLEKMSQPIQKGDVVILECMKRTYYDREQPVEVKIPVPHKYEGDAMIEYVVGGEKKYFVVTVLEKLPRQDHM